MCARLHRIILVVVSEREMFNCQEFSTNEPNERIDFWINAILHSRPVITLNVPPTSCLKHYTALDDTEHRAVWIQHMESSSDV